MINKEELYKELVDFVEDLSAHRAFALLDNELIGYQTEILLGIHEQYLKETDVGKRCIEKVVERILSGEISEGGMAFTNHMRNICPEWDWNTSLYNQSRIKD